MKQKYFSLRLGLLDVPNLVKVGAVTSFWSGFHLDLHQLHQVHKNGSATKGKLMHVCAKMTMVGRDVCT